MWWHYAIFLGYRGPFAYYSTEETMKISERFELNANQFELDFVDIDTDIDLPLFLDPAFINVKQDYWSLNANRTLKSFFQTFVDLFRAGEMDRARNLLNYLHEPNEICLGLSSDRPRGNAIGSVDGEKLFQSIITSRAVETGVVEDIQDFRLFIDGIDRDKVSDMTVNIIRLHLIEYTQSQCQLWSIPMQKNAQSGFYWNRNIGAWETSFQDMLIVEHRPIILVPKAVVSYAKKYTPQKYYNKFVLEFLQEDHINRATPLVAHRRDGSPYVTKASLKDSVAPYSKGFLTEFTGKHPEVFSDFKHWITSDAKSLENEELDGRDSAFIAEYLKIKLSRVQAGANGATEYHRVAVGILEFLLYPDVICPVVEAEIHEGRKRIDIVLDNAAVSGFFNRLHTIYQTPAQFIFAECKNYTREVANPEVDQLSGRFSLNRGKFGILLFREAEDMRRLIQRCNDTYRDGRGVMIPIADADLISMLDRAIEGDTSPYERFFSDRFRQVALP